MDYQAEIKRLEQSLKASEHVEAELDRRVFHLKTLYDVSQDIFSSVEAEVILRNFLLMTMGNFGLSEGFIVQFDRTSGRCRRFIAMGCTDRESEDLQETVAVLCSKAAGADRWACREILACRDRLPLRLELVLPFAVETETAGILGLGPKLIEEAYTEEDRELLDTLVNNLVVALKNARSFERIRNLNVELEAKNTQLEKTLAELKAALRRVEMLEAIKSNLSKFVPTTVNRMVEKSPTGDIRQARERDVSVLFLDIEGYTQLTEKLGATEVNALTERYFSLFMDAIYENNGDVVETAGDGLMVLFQTEDNRQHAVEAVRTARTVIEKACSINEECRLDSLPILINIGICSGQAFVGASRFKGLAGDRWTYTSHGTTTNVAARLCGQAKGGSVFVAGSTADRVRDCFALLPLGRKALKNLSEEVEVFRLEI